jgi:hypothetical protein
MDCSTRSAWSWRAGVLALAALLGAGPALAQAPAALDEPATHARFAAEVRERGTSFRCLGVGVRRSREVKLYAAAYCVELSAAEALGQRYGGRGAHHLEQDRAFYSAAAAAPGDKLVILQLGEKVTRKQLVDAFEKDLRPILPQPQVTQLVAAIPTDLSPGQTALLSAHGDRLTVRMGEQVRTIDDPLITEKLWQVWLGPHSVTPSLKRSVAERLGAPAK